MKQYEGNMFFSFQSLFHDQGWTPWWHLRRWPEILPRMPWRQYKPWRMSLLLGCGIRGMNVMGWLQNLWGLSDHLTRCNKIWVPVNPYDQNFWITMAFTRNGHFFWSYAVLTIFFDHMASQAVFGCLSSVLFLPEHVVGGCPTPDTVQIRQSLEPYVEICKLYFFKKCW